MKIVSSKISLAPMRNETVIPFLKWPGGKRWLVSKFSELLEVQFNRYIEPFLGGGAVFFHLCPNAALLSDINSDLIDCYEAVRRHWKDVRRILRRHQRQHDRDYYYEERNRKHWTLAERAAQLIYLNRTCWNGLYRVNLSGEFNVPIGTKDAVILDTDDFQKTASLLRRAELRAQDFEETIANARLGDFIFVDPPYTVKHNYNGFLKYNERIFSWEDQKRLCGALLGAKSRGAQILMLNADHHSVRTLFRDLGRMRSLTRHSVLSGDASFRGPATELAIFTNGRDK